MAKDKIHPKPAKLPYSNGKAHFMQYGKNIERLIEAAIAVEDEAKKQRLTELICYYMKKSLIERNKENATDKRVIDDLRILSKSQLSVSQDASFVSVEEFRKARF